MKKYYDKIYNSVYSSVTKTLTDKALNKLVKSEYLRDTTSILPLTLLTILIRGSFNFLIVSRLRTENYWFDFPFSVFVTVVLTLFSPRIYNNISRTYDDEIKMFSQSVIDSYWTEGWEYIETWKGRIFGTIGISSIILLRFIDINSLMIQEFIFHTMISSVIVDYLSNISEVDKKYEEIKEDKKLSKTDSRVKIIETPKKIESYSNLISLENENINECMEKTLKYEIINDYSLDDKSFIDMNMFNSENSD